MFIHSSPNAAIHAIYTIEECPQLLADGCVADLSGHLIFLSVWGRDTAIQSLLAQLTLGDADQGIDQLHISDASGARVPVHIGNADRLQKRFTRAYDRAIFKSLSHLWLFDRRCIRPDKANASALALFPREDFHRQERLWALIRETCPLPLLDQWRQPVMDALQSHDMMRQLPHSWGPLDGCQLTIDVPVLTSLLGDLIRNGSLCAERQAEATAAAPCAA